MNKKVSSGLFTIMLLAPTAGVLAQAFPGKVVRIHRDVAAILQLPEVRQRLADVGGEPGGHTPDKFDARIRSEIARWQKVAKAAGIRAQ